MSRSQQKKKIVNGDPSDSSSVSEDDFFSHHKAKPLDTATQSQNHHHSGVFQKYSTHFTIGFIEKPDSPVVPLDDALPPPSNVAASRKRRQHDAYHRPDESELERLRQRRRERRRREGFVDSDDDAADDNKGDDDDASVDANVDSSVPANGKSGNNSNDKSLAAAAGAVVEQLLREVDRATQHSEPHRQRIRDLHLSSVDAIATSRLELDSVQHKVQAATAALRASSAATVVDDKTRTLGFRLPPENELMMVRVRCADTFESIVARVCQFRKIADPHRIVVLVDHIPLPSTAVTVESCGLENDDVVVLRLPAGATVKNTVAISDHNDAEQDDEADGSVDEESADGDADGSVDEESAAGDGGEVTRVAIRVRDRKGVERVYNLPEKDRFSKLFAAYCRDIGIAYSLKFEFDGELVDPKATPASLEIEDDDLLTFMG
jgi:hypothetical protein